jgi:hypothetical protein
VSVCSSVDPARSVVGLLVGAGFLVLAVPACGGVVASSGEGGIVTVVASTDHSLLVEASIWIESPLLLESIRRQIDVSVPAQSAVAFQGTLAAGDYAANVRGTSDTGEGCFGSTHFSVLPGSKVQEALRMSCTRPVGAVRACPTLTNVSIETTHARVGVPIVVRASVNQEAGVGTLKWSATDGGAVADTEAFSAQFTCTAPGTVTLDAVLTQSGTICLQVVPEEIICEP